MSGGVSFAFLAGAAAQAVALGFVDRGDVNTSFVTRAVGTLLVASLFAAGSVLAATASPLPGASAVAGLLVPATRADLVLRLLSRALQVAFWTGKVRPAAILYANDVFPVQAAAMIWNNCAPVQPAARGQDDGTIVTDVLREQRTVWQPTEVDTPLVRAAKIPIYTALRLLCALVEAVEGVLFGMWTALSGRSAANTTLVAVQGARRTVLGHTALISDTQLAWLRESTMRGGDAEEARTARRVLFRAIHLANLFDHGGHTRLHEHPPYGHAMSEYFQRVTGSRLKAALSAADQLGILQTLPNGNSLTRGHPIPKQVMWARLVAGSQLALDGGARWRGPVVSAIFVVAQENVDRWGDSVSRTAVHRHVYTCLRRWMVDWAMYIWWELDIPDAVVEDADDFFIRLRSLLLASLVNNTMSLPYAVGEMAVSEPKTPDVTVILACTVGEEWEQWLSSAAIASGEPALPALQSSGEWTCIGRPIGQDVAVSPRLYKTQPLEDVLQTPPTSPAGDQVRAALAARLVETLLRRVRGAWEVLPHHLLDTPDTAAGQTVM